MLKASYISSVLEAGCDEAGRGPLAGSVFAAAVILDTDEIIREQNSDTAWFATLNDSKQLTEQQRYALRPLIEQHALAWAVAEVTAQEIDQINILNASILAMQRALDKLTLKPGHILVDGNRWKPYVPQGEVMAVPALTVVKGDATYLSIAAASVLAKTYRDDYMIRLHQEYPMYHWDDNKGYPTQAHYTALAQFGASPYHRKTFKLVKTPDQVKKSRVECS